MQLMLHIQHRGTKPLNRRGGVASHAGDRGSIPGRDKSMSMKQVVTARMPHAQQQVLVSWVLGDDNYKQMPRVTVGVER